MIRVEENKLYKIIKPQNYETVPILLIGDHTGKKFPAGFGEQLAQEDRERHIAHDIGTRGVIEHMARLLGAQAIMAEYSRLVVDLNRGAEDPSVIPLVSDTTSLPFNRVVENGEARLLTPAEREARLAEFYYPYDAMLMHEIPAFHKRHPNGKVFFIHSMTEQPQAGGDIRPHLQMLSKYDQVSAEFWIDELKKGIGAESNWTVMHNDPFDGFAFPTCTPNRHCKRVPNALIEIRQDLIGKPADQWLMAHRLLPLVRKYAYDLAVPDLPDTEPVPDRPLKLAPGAYVPELRQVAI
jgi:predicted N-formylglutamate amidohydrolase